VYSIRTSIPVILPAERNSSLRPVRTGLGTVQAGRNPLAHKAHQPTDQVEAREVVVFASMLMRSLDLAEQRLDDIDAAG
jgi:hypothetical protein